MNLLRRMMTIYKEDREMDFQSARVTETERERQRETERERERQTDTYT